MKYKKLASFISVALFILGGCLPSSPGGGSRGDRKKMLIPDETAGRWEGYNLSASGADGRGGQPVAAGIPSLPFVLSDTLFGGGAEAKPYILLRVPTADYDFLLLGAKTYEAWFPGWIKSWSQTGRAGLAIEMATGKVTGQTAMQLSVPGLDNPVPVVLLWDAASSGRADFYTQLLQGLTTIRCENLSSGECH